MRRIYSFLKELRLSSRSYYFYLEIIMALIIIVVLRYVVPEDFSSSIKMYGYINADEQVKQSIAGRFSEEGEDSFTLLYSIDEVVRNMEKERSSIGLLITSTIEEGTGYQFVLQGYESEKMRNILKTSIQMEALVKSPSYQSKTIVETLNDNAERLPDRNNVLPVVLVFNAAFMGLFIIASYVFMDKEEGTIKAFAVTPSRIWEYLLGKMGVMLVTGIISAFLTVFFIAGTNAHYVHLLILLIATNLFGSALGLLVASFFDSMVKAMGTVFIIVFLMAIPSVSYYMPSFSPLPLRLMPAYPMIFAFRETLLEIPDLGFIYLNVAGFTAAAMLLFLLANMRFKKTITT